MCRSQSRFQGPEHEVSMTGVVWLCSNILALFLLPCRNYKILCERLWLIVFVKTICVSWDSQPNVFYVQFWNTFKWSSNHAQLLMKLLNKSLVAPNKNTGMQMSFQPWITNNASDRMKKERTFYNVIVLVENKWVSQEPQTTGSSSLLYVFGVCKIIYSAFTAFSY